MRRVGRGDGVNEKGRRNLRRWRGVGTIARSVSRRRNSHERKGWAPMMASAPRREKAPTKFPMVCCFQPRYLHVRTSMQHALPSADSSCSCRERACMQLHLCWQRMHASLAAVAEQGRPRARTQTSQAQMRRAHAQDPYTLGKYSHTLGKYSHTSGHKRRSRSLRR